MSLICPDCDGAGTIQIQRSIALPPDNRSDDIILQVFRCRQCGLRGAAVYEESRRGSLAGESWSHTGYRLDRRALAELNGLIRPCPAKKDKSCACPSHQSLGQRDRGGRWLPPAFLDWRRSFPMRRD